VGKSIHLPPFHVHISFCVQVVDIAWVDRELPALKGKYRVLGTRAGKVKAIAIVCGDGPWQGARRQAMHHLAWQPKPKQHQQQQPICPEKGFPL